MEAVLTPEEKEKALLARQEQEQKRVRQEAEEDARERSAERRRLRERQNMAFLSYLKIRMEEEKYREEHERFVTKLHQDFFLTHVRQAQIFNQTLLSSLANHDAAVRSFLFAGESEAEREKRLGLLKKLNMAESEFGALAIARLSGRPENREELEKLFCGKQPSDALAAQRRDSLRDATEALEAFSAGKVQKMEAILKDGLSNACHAFSHTKDTLTAIHWSKQINGILSVVNSHPVLFRDGVSTPLLEAATGMAALGRVMENGLQALNQLYTAQLNGTLLEPDREMNLHAQILLMQQTDAQRSNEQYQKFFAKGFDPKKGLQQDNLKALLRQLNTSQAMYTLSTMESSERLFVLSDAESRRTLSEGLFVSHAEKKLGEEKPLEKGPVRNAPGLFK